MYTHRYYTQNIARGKKERKKPFKSTCLQNTNVRYVATEASEVLVASTSSAQSGFPYIMCFAKFSSKELLQTTRLLSIPVLNFRFFYHNLFSVFFKWFSWNHSELYKKFTQPLETNIPVYIFFGDLKHFHCKCNSDRFLSFFPLFLSMFCNLCVCVCVCACMRVHACFSVSVCAHMCMCGYVSVPVYVSLCAPVCVCVCVCMCFLSGCQFCCSLVRWSRPAGKPKSYRPDGRPCCLPWPCASPCTSSGCSSHSWCSTGDPPLDNRQKTQVNFITSLHSSHGTGPRHWTTDRKHKWTLSHHFIAHTAHGPATGQQTENTSELYIAHTAQGPAIGQQTENTSELYHITSYLTRHTALPLDNRQKTQVNFITSLHSSHGTGPRHWTTDRKHKWTLSHHFIAHTAQGPATGQQTENTSELYHITS